MSRRMPTTPMTSPPDPRRAEALRVAGMTSPEALPGWRRTFRVTPRSTTSRRAPITAGTCPRGHQARRGSGIVGPPLRNRRTLQEMPLALQEGQQGRPASPEAPSAPSHGEPDPEVDQQRRRHRAVLLRTKEQEAVAQGIATPEQLKIRTLVCPDS